MATKLGVLRDFLRQFRTVHGRGVALIGLLSGVSCVQPSVAEASGPKAPPADPPPRVEAAIPPNMSGTGSGLAVESPMLEAPLTHVEAGRQQPTPHFPFQEPLPPPELSRAEQLRRYANLSRAECARGLAKRRGLLVRERRAYASVDLAVTVAPSSGEVTLLAPRHHSPFGVLDCRLGLVLYELVPVLAEHGVTQVHIGSMYRPLPRRSKSHQASQHTRGLAADITSFRMEDGELLVVERDWHGRLGAPPCGPESQLSAPSEAALELRNLVCAIAAARLFDTILTPNYNFAHHDHLHVDLRKQARSLILR